MTVPRELTSQSARDAHARGMRASYVDYLERHARELRDYYTRRGDVERARAMLTRTLGEALAGNDGA